MRYLIKELTEINNEELTAEEKIKKKHFIKLAQLVAYMPIQDSQNFKKVYDLYKYSEKI